MLELERREVPILKGKDGAEDFKGSYCYYLATPANMEALDRTLRTIAKEDADFTEHVAACCDLLVNLRFEWNLTDENDQPVPITPEALRTKVSAGLLLAAGGAILTDTRPEALGEQTSPTA